MGIPLRILIIEDVEDDALLVMRVLQKGGYDPAYERVETADAMGEALGRETWDIIISDYSMPHFSGPAALALYKEKGLDIPFIIVSGAIGEEAAVAAMISGAHDYVMKNNLPRLVPAIQRELRDAESRRERKRTEEALRESEDRYRSLYVDSRDAIMMLLPDRGFIAGNPAAIKLFACRDEQDFTARTAASVSPEYQPDGVRSEDKSLEMIRLALENGSHYFEWTHRRADGTDFPATVLLSRIESGGARLLQATVRDNTERKRAEEKQRKLEAQLQQAQKMEAIGTLAGGIAHDFNNILGIIMGHAEIAELKLAKDSPVKRYIDEVVKAAYRAKDLVKQILTFSRRGEQERKPIQIIPIIKESLKFLRASLPMTIEIRPEIELSPGDDLILGDPTQVQQILMNLSMNAAHAMRERGGALRVALSPVHFSSSDVGKPLELSPGNYLKLTVEDSGHGMDQTTIDHIFEPFFTTKGPGQGTGLGLAVVYGIVTSHGGAITVSSRMGKGTAFQVYLTKLETGERAKTEVVAELPKGSERILLVDDEEPLANAVKQLLEYLGYKVTATTGSAEALLAFRRQPEDFDLVITDYTMPNMTGAELAELIVRIRSDIPIILCTGFSERINEEGVRKAGICALMIKPGSLRDFALLVRKVLKTGES